MNTEPTPTPPPPLPPNVPTSPAIDRWSMTSMEGPVTIGNVIDHLLKRPGRLIRAFIDGTAGVNLILILSGMASLVVFGLLLGTFSGSVQLWAAPLKVTGGTLAAVLICLPSLYIFSALGGVHGKLSNVMSMLFAAIALTGLLLLGFAPVIWVFSQSTESVPFVGFLALAFWLISLIFGLRLLIAATHLQGMLSPGYIKVWMSIFVVVTLQMSTALRPIIGTADSFLPKEKRFFVQHWLAEIDTADSKTTIRKPAP